MVYDWLALDSEILFCIVIFYSVILPCVIREYVYKKCDVSIYDFQIHFNKISESL